MLPHPRDKNSVGISNIPLQVWWPFSSPFISSESSFFFFFLTIPFLLALHWLESWQSKRKDEKRIHFFMFKHTNKIKQQFSNGKYTCCSPETSIASILKSENEEVQPTPVSLKNNNYWNKQKCFCKQKKKEVFVFSGVASWD